MQRDELITKRINAIKLHKDPLTQAQLVSELLRDSPMRNIDLARDLEIKPSYLSHLVRVTKLPDMVIDGYWNKQLTFTHLILISRLKKQEDIIALYEEILMKSLNVAATERRIREILYLIDSTGKYVSKERLEAIKSRIESSLQHNASVSIVQTRIKTKIVIDVQGNLVKTSEFIESFANKFRQKKIVHTVEATHDMPLSSTPLIESHSSVDNLTIASNKSPETVSSGGEIQTNTEVKKFRFDPDF